MLLTNQLITHKPIGYSQTNWLLTKKGAAIKPRPIFCLKKRLSLQRQSPPPRSKQIQYLFQPGPQLRQLASQIRGSFDELGGVDPLHALSAEIAGAVAYETGRTDSATGAEQALAAGHGVCQDHSHIMIAAARLLGYPARYVSGYLLMDGQEEQDASHAWAEVWTKGLGWVGFDVSNGICPDTRYVRVATGRDYRDAAPIHGLRQGAGGEALHVSLQVQQ